MYLTEVAEVGPSASAPVIHVGDSDEAPGSRLWPVLALAIPASWGENQWVEHLHLCNSDFQINK